MGRVILNTIAAAVGALVAWLVMERTPLMPDIDTSIPFIYTAIIGIVAGGSMGLLLGLVEAYSGISHLDRRKAIVSGALFGACGGLVGLYFGNTIYGAMVAIAGRHDSPKLGPLSLVLWMIGRSCGWALIGGFIGLSQGIATGSPRKLMNGLIGGLVGGGVGGVSFELMASMRVWQPWMVRMVSFGITGASLGFFLGLVGELTKVAWLMKVLGRNEGKEYQIYKPATVIGRSELVDIPVFGDPDVSERHAMIRSAGGKFVLDSLDKKSSALVNGQRVLSAELRDGDQIKLGNTLFVFGSKSRLRTSKPPEIIKESVVGPDACAYCGQAKDAFGNCACSVGQAIPPVSQAQGPAVMVQGPTVMSPSAQTAGARLVGVSGLYAGTVFPIQTDQATVGRDPSTAVSLGNDNTVSRNHAVVERVGGSWAIRDAGSSNGTFVNGNRVTQIALNSGDSVKIGETVFRFET